MLYTVAYPVFRLTIWNRETFTRRQTAFSKTSIDSLAYVFSFAAAPISRATFAYKSYRLKGER